MPEGTTTRIQLDLSPEALATVNDIVRRGGHPSINDMIRQAVMVYRGILDVTQDGREPLELLVGNKVFEIEGLQKPVQTG